MTTASRRSLPFDPLLIVMIVGFVAAVGAMAWPAFRADPMSAPGLVLIFSAGAVALIGLFGFGRSETKRPPSGDAAVEMLDALAEPAALVWASGQVLAYNAAWAEENGATTALPRGKSNQALYMAFAQARQGHQGRAIVLVGARELEVLIGLAGEGRFLVRAAPEAALPVAAPAPAAPVHGAPAAMARLSAELTAGATAGVAGAASMASTASGAARTRKRPCPARPISTSFSRAPIWTMARP